MKKVRKAAPKDLIVIARIQWKYEDKVVYLVRASNPLVDGQYTLLPKGLVEFNGNTYQSVVRGDQRYLVYQVFFLKGCVAGCQCPARHDCYHKRDLAVIEAKRREAAAPAADVEQIVVTSTTTTEATAEVSEEELDEILAAIDAEHKESSSSSQPSDIATVGSLNSNRVPVAAVGKSSSEVSLSARGWMR